MTNISKKAECKRFFISDSAGRTPVCFLSFEWKISHIDKKTGLGFSKEPAGRKIHPAPRPHSGPPAFAKQNLFLPAFLARYMALSAS